jgi:membrane protein YdbS with pleckstrin-like domain
MSVAYFTPDERLIYYCRKNWFPLFTVFLLGTLFLLPMNIVPIIGKKVPLEVSFIIISATVIYFTACVLGLCRYRKSYLVLSNRRLFLRYGIFFPKGQVIPFETIESITFV